MPWEGMLSITLFPSLNTVKDLGIFPQISFEGEDCSACKADVSAETGSGMQLALSCSQPVEGYDLL